MNTLRKKIFLINQNRHQCIMHLLAQKGKKYIVHQLNNNYLYNNTDCYPVSYFHPYKICKNLVHQFHCSIRHLIKFIFNINIPKNRTFRHTSCFCCNISNITHIQSLILIKHRLICKNCI